MQGQGGYGDLRFSNRKPGSQKPLTFEMSDKQLKQCDSEFHQAIAAVNSTRFISVLRSRSVTQEQHQHDKGFKN